MVSLYKYCWRCLILILELAVDYNVPCKDADPTNLDKQCNPYENLMKIPGGNRKWRMSCDEFPFGNAPFIFIFFSQKCPFLVMC